MNIEQLARDVADKDKVDPWNKDLCTLTKDELQRLCTRVRNEALEELIEKLRALVANDAHACTFQSLGQYRSALLAALLNTTIQRPSGSLE